jgi:predicted aspartyl protease
VCDDMGICQTTVAVEHPAHRGARVEVHDVMLETGSEYTWFARPVLEGLGLEAVRAVHFATADGREIERRVCFANLYVGDSSAPEIVVFAEPGDMKLLGARTLEGLNLRMDIVGKRLVAAGPVPAAAV